MKINKDGTIVVNDRYGITSSETIFAGGDVVTGSLTVANAIKTGLEIANNILNDNI